MFRVLKFLLNGNSAVVSKERLGKKDCIGSVGVREGGAAYLYRIIREGLSVEVVFRVA